LLGDQQAGCAAGQIEYVADTAAGQIYPIDGVGELLDEPDAHSPMLRP
jgi:hypothetical protein